ncbi:MAG: ammonia-forming cytochrome c nitrite reductase subunit c552 [Gammaproteobacteria bacterium]|nr:ammonia-forming cytochrome c nitrite reductase subunit c552 [Gammaproteobacteria bacterium]
MRARSSPDCATPDASRIAAAPQIVARRHGHALLAALLLVSAVPGRAQPVTPGTYVGSAACAACHAGEHAAWAGTQHALAMQAVAAGSVQGDFNGARYERPGLAVEFTRAAGDPVVRIFTRPFAANADERRPAFVIGVEPLQQYLLPLDGGRLQAFTIAWDTRPATAGGQRWFDLQPGVDPEPGGLLHWAGPGYNWNHQCADCHTTGFRKRYDVGTRRYDSRYAELGVGCEACHGPAARHLDWARTGSGPDTSRAGRGFDFGFHERDGVSWRTDPVSALPQRSEPRTSETEIGICARCHARRERIADGDAGAGPPGEQLRVALLVPPLYRADGQVADEVFVYGSFAQSRMYRAGVTCADCHDPHALTLRAPGNALCTRCHEPDRYEAYGHHFHPAGTPGSACVDCHMPATTFMGVDARREHAFRIPRPDLSPRLDTRDACTDCHADRSPAWAARILAARHPGTPPPAAIMAEAFAAAALGAPDAALRLQAVFAEPGQSALVRASAVARAANLRNRPALALIQTALGDPSPLVRRAAVDAHADLPPAMRRAWLAALSADPVLDVRIAAAAALAGVRVGEIPAGQRPALAQATAELERRLRLDADRPEAYDALGRLRAAQGDTAGAEQAYREALRLAPGFAPAAVNLADLYRELRRDTDGERLLRATLRANPAHAGLEHALGLLLVRAQRLDEATQALRRAARHGSDIPRYGFVYAVALYEQGLHTEAVAALDEVLQRHPWDAASLQSRVAYALADGDSRTARAALERLIRLEPGNANWRALRARIDAQAAPVP